MVNLLFVDDDLDILSLLAEYFQPLGYRLILARNGREAIEVVRQVGQPIHVAVIDWSLPDISGKDVAVSTRQAHPQCRILVTTGHGSDTVSEGYIGTLVTDIIRKPFKLRTLAHRIESLVSSPAGTRGA